MTQTGMCYWIISSGGSGVHHPGLGQHQAVQEHAAGQEDDQVYLCLNHIALLIWTLFM